VTASQQVSQPLICFAGPLPPPLHGMAAVNGAIVERMRTQARVVALNAAPQRQPRGLFYHLAKATRALSIMVRIVATRGAGSRSFYGSVDDGLGGLWTSAFALSARLCGYRLFLHHHSFRYVDQRRRIMGLLTTIAGQRCCHIVLCETMAAKLEAGYQSVKCTMVVPNVVPNSTSITQEAPQRLAGSPIVLGLLSNLMFEKGVAEFVAIIEQGRANGNDVQGILAGPAWNSEVEAFIIAAVARNDGALQWVGPVSGEAKEDFFAAIDLFVFPTKYPSEAYPLVLIEALIRGCPIVAPDRGCIGTLRTLKSATIVDIGLDFVATTVSHIERSPHVAERSLASSLARAEGFALNAANHEARERLVAAILAY
jgi:glycosyltransferase involved in cell wall biosynthesis